MVTVVYNYVMLSKAREEGFVHSSVPGIYVTLLEPVSIIQYVSIVVCCIRIKKTERFVL